MTTKFNVLIRPKTTKETKNGRNLRSLSLLLGSRLEPSQIPDWQLAEPEPKCHEYSNTPQP